MNSMKSNLRRQPSPHLTSNFPLALYGTKTSIILVILVHKLVEMNNILTKSNCPLFIQPATLTQLFHCQKLIFTREKDAICHLHILLRSVQIDFNIFSHGNLAIYLQKKSLVSLYIFKNERKERKGKIPGFTEMETGGDNFVT